MKKRIKSIGAYLLLLAVLFSSLNLGGIMSEAAVVTKKVKTYEIAVIFDNSGSMYAVDGNRNTNGIEAWCRAKYAMEIFRGVF